MSDLFPRPRRNPDAGKRNRSRAKVSAVPAPPEAAAYPPAPESVGLRPKNGWLLGDFVTDVLIPSYLAPRTGKQQIKPTFPHLRAGQICITWIGHASFLVQIGGRNILIDPNWSLWLKVIKRVRKPGLRIRDLPLIDLVLVTHAHFDHLDKRTLRAVAANQPIAVPFGVGSLVHDLGFERVHELDHWGSVAFGDLKVTLTPCHHWGARILADQHRGYGGFVISQGGRSVFHCGDTAYFEGFREIGERCPIEIALMPIGAYDAPTGREVHMNPEEAVQSFVELNAKWLVPMHYGSFPLGLEPINEPPERLVARACELGIEDRVILLEEGHPWVF